MNTIFYNYFIDIGLLITKFYRLTFTNLIYELCHNLYQKTLSTKIINYGFSTQFKQATFIKI